MKLMDRYIDALHRATRRSGSVYFSFRRSGAVFNVVVAAVLTAFCAVVATREPFVLLVAPLIAGMDVLFVRVLVRVYRNDFA